MKFKSYLSLVKFSHTIFALPFALIGFVLALVLRDISFSWLDFGLVLLCMVTGRNAAMGFNRYLDRDIDKANPRTAEVREIPNGTLKPNAVLGFVLLNCGIFWLATWFLNPLCFALAPLVLGVLLFYSYTKRFSALCHLVLGLGLAIAPLAAWLALTAEFSMTPVWFSLAVLCWVAGFDIIYALQDEEFDKAQGLHSIPSYFGRKRSLNLSRFLHLLTALFLFLAGYLNPFGLIYWIGYGIFIALLVFQHSLVKPNDLSKVNLAFFTTNGIASVTFGALVIIDLLF